MRDVTCICVVTASAAAHSFNGYEYVAVNRSLSWTDAQEYCQTEYGSHLPSVASHEDNEFLAQFASTKYNGYAEVWRIKIMVQM